MTTVATGGLSLPAGKVDAFGFWWDRTKAQNSRMDTIWHLLDGGTMTTMGSRTASTPARSPILSETAVVDSCNFGVTNAVDASSCTMADSVAACSSAYSTRATSSAACTDVTNT